MVESLTIIGYVVYSVHPLSPPTFPSLAYRQNTQFTITPEERQSEEDGERKREREKGESIHIFNKLCLLLSFCFSLCLVVLFFEYFFAVC